MKWGGDGSSHSGTWAMPPSHGLGLQGQSGLCTCTLSEGGGKPGGRAAHSSRGIWRVKYGRPTFNMGLAYSGP
eukprot:1437115-Karenia_brevis.AAC.1